MGKEKGRKGEGWMRGSGLLYNYLGTRRVGKRRARVERERGVWIMGQQVATEQVV
jgi:hypothetical protein